MQRFCALMNRGLTARGHDVQILRPQEYLVRLVPKPAMLQKWLGYIDKFAFFPWALIHRVRSYDVIHICDHSNAIYTRFLRGQPTVVTCHDLMAVRSARGEVAENPTGWSGRALQRAIARGLERAQVVVCVSEHTRRNVIRLIRREQRLTTSVPNALNYAYTPMEKMEARQRVSLLFEDETRRFFLHVGGNQWYKNRLGVLRIFANLRSRRQFAGYRLIMVGKPFTDQMRSLIHRQALDQEIVELTNLENEDLRALYSLAEGLIFPSLEEGFGWTIIEAQACGCPVFTSDRAPMTEVGGRAGVYFDPDDPPDAAEAIAAGLTRRSEMVELGLKNASRFGSGAMIEAYEETYRLAISGRPRL